MQPLRLSELIEFSGGINTVKAPYLLNLNESRHLENSNVSKGALTSISAPLFDRVTKFPYFFYYANKVYLYGSWRSNVIWDNKWYWSDGSKVGKVYPDGTEYELGIEEPYKALQYSTIDNEDSPLFNDYKYTYTYYDNNHGVESAPAPLTPYIKGDKKSIQLKGFIKPTEKSVTHYRLYRIGGYSTMFSLVAEIPITQTTYIDELDDTQIDGRELLTIKCGKPPFGLHYLIELNGRLYGAVGNKLYFSALGNPDSWYIYDFIPFRDTIVALAKSPNGLLVMGNNWIQIYNPYNKITRVLSDVIGCKNVESIGYYNNNVIWLSQYGLMISNGYSINSLTKDKIEEVGGLVATGAVVINDIYYMSFKPDLYPSETLYPDDSLYPSKVIGTFGVEQGILKIDFKRGVGFSYSLINLPKVQYIDEYKGYIGLIYGDYGTPVFPNYEDTLDCDRVFECGSYQLAYLNKHKEYKVTSLTPSDNLLPNNYLYPNDVIDFGWSEANELLPLKYISPLLVEGTPTTLKEYEKVRIRFRGSFEFTILIDNVQIQKVKLSSKDFATETVGIPNNYDKGHSIQFILEGVGIVRGIQYSWQVRDSI